MLPVPISLDNQESTVHVQLIIWERTVSKMVPIECTVCMQQSHYSLSKSCICGTARNFDSIVAKICTCLDNGPRMDDLEYGPYWIESVCVISNTSLDGSTYLILSNSRKN